MPAKRLLACLLALAGLGIAACGGDNDDASPVTVDPADETTTTGSTTTTTKPTTTTAEVPDDPIEAVRQAFFAEWDAYLEVAAEPDPDHPLLAQHYTGLALDGVRQGMRNLTDEGKYITRPDDPERFVPRILRIEPFGNTNDQYVLTECTIQGLVIHDADTDEVIDDGISEFNRRRVFLHEDGRWKVAVSTTLNEGDPTCDEI